MTEADRERRLERVESELAIRGLAARYALAIDGRDLDGLVALFVDDVDCGRHGRGRDVLQGFFANALRGFYRSAHLVCGHVIDLGGDPTRATGVVSCRAEHEVGPRWVIQTFCYFDDYARRDGSWYFQRRRTRTWYTADVDARPVGPDFSSWEGALPGRLPQAFAGWQPFWEQPGADPGAVTDFPVDA